jgi:hypothetical protein
MVRVRLSKICRFGFWANDEPLRLAQSLKSALQQTNVKKQ